MKTLRTIRVISDGRPGHENQSVGLAQALARRTGATYEIVNIDPRASLWKRAHAAAQPGSQTTAHGGKVDLVISAGHRTHLPLWWAARKLGARSVVIMKPSLPLAFFDLALVPRHDCAADADDTAKRVLTRGALNRLPEDIPAKSAKGIILIGGPSKHHDWAAEPLLAAIADVVRREPDLEWTLTDSRRTPEGFIEHVAALKLPSLTLVPNAQTPRGWLPERLIEARVAWVTEDSVSMVFEAITAGAKTSLLPMVAKNPDGRIARSINDVVAAGFAERYAAVSPASQSKSAAGTTPKNSASTPPRLHEAGRCADEIIKRFFADNARNAS